MVALLHPDLLGPGGAVRELPGPVHHPLSVRCRWRLGALMFAFLGFTSVNIYSQAGSDHARGPVSQNGILTVEFSHNHLREEGLDKVRAVIRSGDSAASDLMTTAATVAGHTTPLISRAWSWSSRPQQHWNGAGDRHDHWDTAFTLFVVPAIYVVVARTRRQKTAVSKMSLRDGEPRSLPEQIAARPAFASGFQFLATLIH